MKNEKGYEEFINSSDIEASGLNPVITAEIEKLLMPMLRGEQLLGVDTTLQAPKSGKKRVYRFRNIRHEPIAFNENDDIPDVIPVDPYSTIEVEPEYFGGKEPVTGEAIDDADFNVLDEVRNSLAEGMAILKDARVWAAIFDVHQVTDEAVGATDEWQLAVFATPPSPPATGILEFDASAVTGATLVSIDYVNGWVKFSGVPTGGTVSYTYTTRQVIKASTDGELNYDDIVDARASIIGDYGRPDTIILDPLSSSDLLKDDKFIDASSYGSAVMMNGEIGKIAGMPVIVAQNIPDYTCVVLQKGPMLGYTCYKRKMFAKVEPQQKRPGDVWIETWEKSKPVVLRPYLIRIILNAAPNSYTHT